MINKLLYEFLDQVGDSYCAIAFDDVSSSLTTHGFLVFKETVVLRRWGRSKQKFGFIKRVDKG